MSRVSLVTGAGSGIGRAAALALMDAGDSVILVGRRPETLAETAALAPDGNSLCLPADITDPLLVDGLFAEIGRRFGRIDLLFNNAGTATGPINFGDLDYARWRQVLAVNLDGMFLMASGAFRMMRNQTPQGGRIINNGSISAHAPRPGSAPYTASKHGVTGLTKSIALDGRAYGIACGQIDIGNAATPMTDRMAEGVPQPDGRIMPEPRMDVADVGRSILLMASLPPEANVQFMTVMATTMPFLGRG